MKPIITSRRSSGSILVTSIMSLAILGSLLSGYLLLLRHQHSTTVRSQIWSKGMPVAEAGIEEALTQLNANGKTVQANYGFALTHDKYVLKRSTFSGNEYLVGISVSTNPVIVSQSFAKVPYAGATVSRIIKVRATLVQLFPVAVATDKGIDLKGKNVLIDGFDSQDQSYSTNGQYVASKRKNNVRVVTNSSLDDSVHLGNATIYGQVSTGPDGTVDPGPNGSIGDIAWVSAGTKGIQTGSVTDNTNLSFPPVEPPYTSASPPPSVKVDDVKYDYVLDSGDYKIASPLKFGGNVLVRGSARLLVTEDIKFSGSDQLTIAPGGSLQLYMSGANASFSGNGVVNQTGSATNFIYYGLPSNTSVSYSGNATFIGGVYAPQADVTLGGGGSSNTDFVGGIVSNGLKMNGNMNIHYDEALTRNGPSRGFVATSWEEINTTWDEILQSDLDLNLL